MVRCCKLELIVKDVVGHSLNNEKFLALQQSSLWKKVPLKHFFFCHLVLLLNAHGQWECVLMVLRFTYLAKGYSTYTHLFRFVCVYCLLLSRSKLSKHIGMYFVLCGIKKRQCFRLNISCVMLIYKWNCEWGKVLTNWQRVCLCQQPRPRFPRTTRSNTDTWAS